MRAGAGVESGRPGRFLSLQNSQCVSHFFPLEDIIMFFILGVQVYHRDIFRYLSFSSISARVLISWPFAEDKSWGISRNFLLLYLFFQCLCPLLLEVILDRLWTLWVFRFLKHFSKFGLNIRITWEASKSYQCWTPSPKRLDLIGLWQGQGNSQCFKQHVRFQYAARYG